jgi:hypothetical protein
LGKNKICLEENKTYNKVQRGWRLVRKYRGDGNLILSRRLTRNAT